jgi:Mg2+ and Co2+ transporter CorA
MTEVSTEIAEIEGTPTLHEQEKPSNKQVYKMIQQSNLEVFYSLDDMVQSLKLQEKRRKQDNFIPGHTWFDFENLPDDLLPKIQILFGIHPLTVAELFEDDSELYQHISHYLAIRTLFSPLESLVSIRIIVSKQFILTIHGTDFFL